MYIPYWISQCPQCKTTYEGALGMPGWCRMGFERVICPKKSCGAIIRTNATEWNHMTPRQKLGYSLSGIVVLTLATVYLPLVAAFLIFDKKDLDTITSEFWIGLFAWSIFLVTVKFIRIMRSRSRCPEGAVELTLVEQHLPVIPGVLLVACGLIALVLFYWLPPDRYELSYALLVASIFGLCCWYGFRWRIHKKEAYRAAVAGSALGVTPPPLENPWTRDS